MKKQTTRSKSKKVVKPVAVKKPNFIKTFFRKLYDIFIGSSWQTTLIGYGIALGLGFQDFLVSRDFSKRNLIICVGIALLSRLMKDANKTGV